jgi:Pyocin activator protein PrtN
MNTALLLMARHDCKAIVPPEDVRRDFFPHLTLQKLLKKLSSGDIALPVVRIESSQKCAKGIYLHTLAEYLDKRQAAAVSEYSQLHGSS